MTAVDDTGQQVERLLTQLAAADPASHARAVEVLQLVLGMHADGLGGILELLQGSPVLDQLVADERIANLLILHDLHPVSVRSRIERALDGVRPYLQSHGGDVELLDIVGDAVTVRMLGTCDGCPSSSVTLELAVEEAVLSAAPEMARLVAADQPNAPSLLQIQPLRGQAPKDEPPPTGTWVSLPPVTEQGLSGAEVGGLEIVLCHADTTTFAYRDRCGTCTASFATGVLDGDILTCGECAAAFNVHLAGQPLAGGTALEALPLLQDDNGLRIAVPVAA